MNGIPKDFRVDPAKIDARIAEYEACAVEQELIADALELHAEGHRDEAAKLRKQNAALLVTARQYGYPAVSA